MIVETFQWLHSKWLNAGSPYPTMCVSGFRKQDFHAIEISLCNATLLFFFSLDLTNPKAPEP